MGKKDIGYLVIALSGLLLAIEFYSLKLTHLIDYGVGYPYRYESPLAYLGDPAILIAVLITVGVLIFGFCLIRKK